MGGTRQDELFARGWIEEGPDSAIEKLQNKWQIDYNCSPQPFGVMRLQNVQDLSSSSDRRVGTECCLLVVDYNDQRILSMWSIFRSGVGWMGI